MKRAPLWIAALLVGLVFGYLVGSAPRQGVAGTEAMGSGNSEEGYYGALMRAAGAGDIPEPGEFCWGCNGNGGWPCAHCGGTGRFCMWCDGDGWTKCPRCQGAVPDAIRGREHQERGDPEPVGSG